MDLMAAIGLLSSIVTLEEAGRSWVWIKIWHTCL